LIRSPLTGAIPSKNQWFASKEARTEAFSSGIETARVGAYGTEAYGTLTAHPRLFKDGECDLTDVFTSSPPNQNPDPSTFLQFPASAREMLPL
jgi:hypothetical protein